MHCKHTLHNVHVAAHVAADAVRVAAARATVRRLQNLRGAGVAVPECLNCIQSIGDLRQLIALCDTDAGVLKQVPPFAPLLRISLA